MSSRFKPSHRLNLLLVPSDPERELDEEALSEGLRLLEEQGFVQSGRAGPRAEELVAGGFKLLRVDRPPEPTLYGNRQGGFYARCPSCGGHLVAAIGPALKRWRAGQGRGLSCSSCRSELDLAGLDYAPHAAPGRFALELRDVGDAQLRPTEALRRAMGGDYSVVGSRG